MANLNRFEYWTVQQYVAAKQEARGRRIAVVRAFLLAFMALIAPLLIRWLVPPHAVLPPGERLIIDEPKAQPGVYAQAPSAGMREAVHG